MNIIIKILLAILFFLCLFDLPYGYFQLVRFIAMVGFVILAYQAHEQSLKSQTFIFICLGILFQPLVKIALGRQMWNIIDVIVGIGLLISIFITSSESKVSAKRNNE